MNIISAISAIVGGLKSQNLEMPVYQSSGRKEAQTNPSTETSEFQSILNLLDNDGNGTLDTGEVSKGLEHFITSFVSERDNDGDLALNEEETGIHPAAFNHLDVNADRVLDEKEIIEEAGRILDGLFSLLDVNGDELLSREELAILELLFGSKPLAERTVETSADMVFSRRSTSEGEILELDMDTLPERMRQAGFQGSDNALYYALAHVYHYGPEVEMPDDGAGSLAELNTRRQELYQWFDREIEKVRAVLQANPKATLTAITHDGRDRCGFRLGEAILVRLSDFGDRVRLGDVLPESAY